MQAVPKDLWQTVALHCPNCDYVTYKAGAIWRHCFRRDTLVWQGKRLLLREPLESEIPVLEKSVAIQCPNCDYVTSKYGAIRRHCFRRHTLVWQGKRLPLREPFESEILEKNCGNPRPKLTI